MDMIQVKKSEAAKARYPPGCKVYICNNELHPALIVSHGVIENVVLHRENEDPCKLTYAYEVAVIRKNKRGDYVKKLELSNEENLRFSNGCKVFLRTEREHLKEATVMGFCDMPKHDTLFWYSVKEDCDEEEIHDRVFPEQLSYRNSRTSGRKRQAPDPTSKSTNEKLQVSKYVDLVNDEETSAVESNYYILPRRSPTRTRSQRPQANDIISNLDALKHEQKLKPDFKKMAKEKEEEILREEDSNSSLPYFECNEHITIMDETESHTELKGSEEKNQIPQSTLSESKDEKSDFEFKGEKVAKYFGDKLYEGTIISFDEKQKWWRVRYSDGDTEELEKEEIAEGMDLFKKMDESQLLDLENTFDYEEYSV